MNKNKNKNSIPIDVDGKIVDIPVNKKLFADFNKPFTVMNK